MRTLRPILAAVLLGLVVAVSAGCGVGEPTSEGKLAATADAYLRALATGNSDEACAQLTAGARAALMGPCPSAMEAIAKRVGAERLAAAADQGVSIEVDGDRGLVEIPQLPRARLGLVEVGEQWRIATGQTLEE